VRRGLPRMWRVATQRTLDAVEDKIVFFEPTLLRIRGAERGVVQKSQKVVVVVVVRDTRVLTAVHALPSL
jgi:hypothetical protein